MKRLVVIPLLLFFALVAALGVVIARGRDVPAPDVSDLRPERLGIPEADNAYTHFLAATNTFQWPKDMKVVQDMLAGRTWDVAVARDIIASNQATLAMLSRGVGCRAYEAPEMTDFAASIPHVVRWRSLGRLLALQAIAERRAGDLDASVVACGQLVRFGGLLIDNPDCLIGYLVGVAVLEMGLEQARQTVGADGVTAAHCLALSREVATVDPLSRGMVRALKIEHRLAGKAVDDIASGRYGLRDLAVLDVAAMPPIETRSRRIPVYFFQPNATKALFAGHYRMMIADAPLPYAGMRDFETELRVIRQPGWRHVLRPNVVGRILCGMMTPAVAMSLERMCRTESSVAATRLIAACRAFERETGARPDDLNALIPRYLDTVPRDPYDGKPFRYVRDAPARVYSVGTDLQDAGGSDALPPDDEVEPWQRRWRGEDFVFPIHGEESPAAGPSAP